MDALPELRELWRRRAELAGRRCVCMGGQHVGLCAFVCTIEIEVVCIALWNLGVGGQQTHLLCAERGMQFEFSINQ